MTSMWDAFNKVEANFMCGGSLKIDANVEGASNSTSQVSCSPVVLRWDGEGTNKINFPQTPDDDASESLSRLLAKGKPATFGRGSEDVLDESYRKATKLDDTEFSTNFHPHDVGIVDAIKQTLFSTLVAPGQSQGSAKDAYVKGFGVIARGQLRVAHRGRDMIFDWSKEDLNKIHSAAFSSDCEHEVLEVTKGHRITLTYNLFMTAYPSSVVSLSPTTITNPEMYPLFHEAQGLLQDHDQLAGRSIGFKCTHAYAHAHDCLKRTLPYALKGLDAIVYAVFIHLGCDVHILPSLESTEDMIEEEKQAGNGYLEDRDEDGLRKPKGRDCIGTKLRDTQFIANYVDCSGNNENVIDVVSDTWDHDGEDILWLNYSRASEDLAMVYMDHQGNQAEPNWFYSTVTLIIDPSSDSEEAASSDGSSQASKEANMEWTLTER